MCVVTALVALVNVNAYGDTPCGNWVSPNYPKTADFESERPYGLKTKTADESTAVACTKRHCEQDSYDRDLRRHNTCASNSRCPAPLPAIWRWDRVGTRPSFR
jgi:hypothetical protein